MIRYYNESTFIWFGPNMCFGNKKNHNCFILNSFIFLRLLMRLYPLRFLTVLFHKAIC